MNCDWALTGDVKEIFSRLGFADGFSRRVKLETRAEKPDVLAGYTEGD